MQQTLLSLTALLVVGLYAFNMNRNAAQTERAAYQGELEMVGADAVRQRLRYISSLAFDEADVGATQMRWDTNGLDATPGPEPDETAVASYDDIDDFHGYTTVDSLEWNGQPVPFRVRVAVRYVRVEDPTQVATGVSLAKEIAVQARSVASPSLAIPPIEVNLAQVVTPSWSRIHR